MAVGNLRDVRDRLQEIDAALIELAAERIRLAKDVARAKAADGRPTIDYGQERRVLDRAAAAASAAGIEPDVAERLLLGLIEASVTVQEDERLRLHAHGEGKTAVVVGGAGRMGGWLTRFLAALGHTVHVLDPAMPDAMAEAKAAMPSADIVFLAAPPSRIAALYTDWAGAPPQGILCDVASIKEPILAPLARLQEAGARVASIHPLFGPGVRVLRGVDLVVCDTGDDEATREVAELFTATTARIVHVPIKEHDAWMADVLGLAHATTLAFAGALPDQPRPVRSATLGALSDIAWGLTHESPEVYYEIQADNPHAAHALDRLAGAVASIRALIDQRDPDGFKRYMLESRDRLVAHREVEA